MRRLIPTANLLVDWLTIGQLSRVTRRNSQAFTVEAVGDADQNRIDIVQPIQICNSQLVDPVDHRRITRRDRVEPAAATRPTCSSAKFTSQFMKHFGQTSIFSRQWALAHARG